MLIIYLYIKETNTTPPQKHTWGGGETQKYQIGQVSRILGGGLKKCTSLRDIFSPDQYYFIGIISLELVGFRVLDRKAALTNSFFF